MAVTENKATAIGDTILIEAEAPIIGLIGLTDFIDSITGETASRFFLKEFRYSTNGGLFFSDWQELTQANLQAISVNSTDVFKIEYRYTRIGTSTQGELAFDDITLQGEIQEPVCGPTYQQSVFAQFFKCTDTQVLAWCINVTTKLYNRGIVPSYITRAEGDLSEDKDYYDFWSTVACFFALFVYYARTFESFFTRPELLRKYLRQKGLYICELTELDEMLHLMNNFLDEMRKRGTFEIIKQKPDRVVNGELLRLLCYDANCDEFIFHTPKAQYTGWKIGTCSPLYKGTMAQQELIKAYEETEDVQDLANYPIFNPAYVAAVTDNLGNTRSQQWTIAVDFDNAEIDGFIGLDVSENGGTPVEIRVAYTKNPAQIIQELILAINSSSLSLTASQHSNEAVFVEGIPGTSYEATQTLFTLINQLDYSQREAIEITGVPGTEKAGIGPSVEGSVLDPADADKAIVVDPRVDYEITFSVKKTAVDANLSFGVVAFDAAGNRQDMRSARDNSSRTYFFERETLNIVGTDDQYYRVRGIIYSQSSLPLVTGGYELNLGYGEHLRFTDTVCKIIPIVHLDNTLGGGVANDSIFIHDFKVRPARTPYSIGFVNSPNIIQMWLKNRNGEKTLSQVEEIIRRFLIPYNTTLKILDLDNIENIQELEDFDFAVIRYKWTETSGRDIDTRTAVINSGVDYNGNPIDDDAVGWAVGNTVGDVLQPYLLWAGDNTTLTGAEAVLVDFKKISADYPELEKIEVEARAFWYSALYDGRIELEFETFKGGAMQDIGTDFINVGGTPIQKITLPRVVTETRNLNGTDGQVLACVNYHPAIKGATIELK